MDEKELRAMGQLVSGYLDFAERQAEREIPMTMTDWARHLDGILTSTGENLLIGNGSISHLQAMDKDIIIEISSQIELLMALRGCESYHK